MKASWIILVAITISGCGSDDKYNAGFNISDDHIRSQIIAELEKADIPFNIDDEGMIHYEEKYKTIVTSLSTHFITESIRAEEKKYGFYFAEDINPVAFWAYLSREGISTENLIRFPEENAVFWKEEDDEIMRKHLDIFLLEYREWQRQNDNSAL